MQQKLSESFIRKVREESDIVQVVQSYLPLQKKQNRFWACCPFHQEKTPSFTVNEEKQLFYCFGCHTGGDVFKFIERMEHISYIEAVKRQAEILHIQIPTQTLSEQEIVEENHRKQLRDVMALAGKFFFNCLTLTKLGQVGRDYFEKRQIPQKMIEEFQLGFAPNSYQAFHAAFLKRGFSQETLLEVGLIKQNLQTKNIFDTFRNRVMFPIFDANHRIIAFGGRVIDDKHQPKYLNSCETQIFSKRNILFGLPQAKQEMIQKQYAIVCEGYMDAIGLHSHGICNAVASLGTAFTLLQCRLLLRYAPTIYFCFDSDRAGQMATLRALKIMKETGGQAKVIIIPDGKDPDEFIKKHDKAAFLELIDKAESIVDFQIGQILKQSDLRTVKGKELALKKILPILKETSLIEQHEYLRQLAQRLTLDEAILQRALQNVSDAEKPEEIEKISIQEFHPIEKNCLNAGRFVIQRMMEAPVMIDIVNDSIAIDAIVFEPHKRILKLIKKKVEEGQFAALDVHEFCEELDEAAQKEFLALMAMDFAINEKDYVKAFENNLKILKKDELQRKYRSVTAKFFQAVKDGETEEICQELSQEEDRLRRELQKILNSPLDDL